MFSPSFSLTRTHPFSPRWRDAEEQWNLRRLILTLFYYSPSLASELSRISMGLHSLSWWKDSCAAESPVYSPALRSTRVYNQSLHFHAHIRAIKNKSKTVWCKPFVNLMFAGTFWIKKKESLSRLAASLNRPSDDDILTNVTKQLTLLPTVFPLFSSVSVNLYDTIWSPLRMLICTSINSYLKDKSKHVCFLFVFFPLLNSPKAFMSTLVIRTRAGFSWRRGAEDALMYS